jgi:rubrerythrin
MSEKSTLDILKNAILLEKRGRAFYRTVAEQAQHPAVKTFFGLMADEERMHVDLLSEQFKSYQGNGRFQTGSFGNESSGAVADRVLSEQMKTQIAAAEFEAAAISAALAMEKKAVELYSTRAGQTADPEEKALYEWLAQWERSHLEFLSDIDRELTEKIWNDNNFWPF